MKRLILTLPLTLSLLLGACEQPQKASTDNNQTKQAAQKETDQNKSKENNSAATEDKGTSKNEAKTETKTNQATKHNTTKPQSKVNRAAVTLIETVDGDTIKVNYKGKEETVRYLLVDTPESKKPGTCVQPFAKDAAERNRQLVNSGKLTLEFEKSRTDKYGRLLAYVFVDGKSVQETLLKEGYARVAYVYEPPYKYLSTYEKAEDSAQAKHLRIWSRSGYVTNRGFVGCVAKVIKTQPSKPKVPSTPKPEPVKTNFANCTDLRRVYPNGVPSSHPAYQPKMDRDHDNYACERN
ncbi:thermonuclease family protein [Fictibacillus gelatini]|uniref:thermonuclease family protein n=1 Tax=Fictibacillus gelatini TaxID=225985 RepID=UPI0003FB26E8|nr:thermonuclease family protein [Fictibacillus gelatini]